MTTSGMRTCKKRISLRERTILAATFMLLVSTVIFAAGGAFAHEGQDVIFDYVDAGTPDYAVRMIQSGALRSERTMHRAAMSQEDSYTQIVWTGSSVGDSGDPSFAMSKTVYT